MRFPFPSIEAAQAVTLVSGNQFQGLGVTGSQTESGSASMVRRVGVPSWTRLPLRFNSTSGNTKYFSASIPGNTFQGGDLIEYYFEIDYSDRQKTFVQD
jgi:hypothetical protein